MNEKVPLDFQKISEALWDFPFPKVDHVIGVATGGTMPAGLVAHQLKRPLSLLHINYRAPDNSPAHPAPVLLRDVMLPKSKSHILLVDDVSVSGVTLSLALSLLKDFEVFTFVLKGQADYVLFPEIKECVNWPWKR